MPPRPARSSSATAPRARRSPLLLLLGRGTVFHRATCSDRASTNPSAPFRAAFIADTHLIGPQDECCSESPGVDDWSSSIRRAASSCWTSRRAARSAPAHTWTYDGDPMPLDGEVETGDCVIGLG